MANEIISGGDSFDEIFSEKMNKTNAHLAAAADTLSNLGGIVDTLAKGFDEIVRRQAETEGEIETINHTLANKIFLDEDQAADIYDSVHNRVAYLLEDSESPKSHRYYGVLIRRLWGNLKHQFRARKYIYIKAVDYDAAMDFIKNWVPMGGVQALKDEVDRWE